MKNAAARKNVHLLFTSAHGAEPCHPKRAFSLAVQASEDDRKRCPRNKSAPVLAELLLVVQAGPFPLLFGLFFPSSFLHDGGPLSHLSKLL